MSENLKSRLSASVILLVTLVFASCQHNENGNVDPHAGPTMNHHEINNRLATGGHFVDGGLAAVKEKGLQVVIDLRDEPPAGQKAKLAKLGTGVRRRHKTPLATNHRCCRSTMSTLCCAGH